MGRTERGDIFKWSENWQVRHGLTVPSEFTVWFVQNAPIHAVSDAVSNFTSCVLETDLMLSDKKPNFLTELFKGDWKTKVQWEDFTDYIANKAAVETKVNPQLAMVLAMSLARTTQIASLFDLSSPERSSVADKLVEEHIILSEGRNFRLADSIQDTFGLSVLEAYIDQHEVVDLLHLANSLVPTS